MVDPRNRHRTGRRQEKQGEGLGLVRALNEQAVLETIVNNGEITRPEIAQRTGLSLPTVSSLVGNLEAIELLGTQGTAFGAVGRPAALYSVNPRAGYVFAVDLGGTKITAGIADLFGRIVVESSKPTAGASADAIVAQLSNLYQNLLTKSGFDAETAGVACVGIPGIWDPESDSVEAAYNLPRFGDLPIQATLERELGVPIVIENDVNLAAVGERWKGRARGLDTFIAISIGTGIGMGIIIEGEIYRGRIGAAGELGLLPIGADPYDPALREHGPFEAAAAGASIIRRFRSALSSGAHTSLRPDADVADVFQAAADGDATAAGILDDEARTLAVGIAAAVAILDPELVVLGGGIGANKSLGEAVQRYARELVPWMPAIEISELGNRAAFHGAVALALQAVRSQILTDSRATK